MRKFLLVIVGIALASASFMLPTFATDDKCAAAVTFASFIDSKTGLRRLATVCNTIWDKVVVRNCTISAAGVITTNTDGSTTSAKGQTKASTCP